MFKNPEMVEIFIQYNRMEGSLIISIFKLQRFIAILRDSLKL